MLMFSPNRRLTLEEALEHPYFASVRSGGLEALAEEPVDFEFDGEKELDMGTLRDMFREEVMRYNVNN